MVIKQLLTSAHMKINTLPITAFKIFQESRIFPMSFTFRVEAKEKSCTFANLLQDLDEENLKILLIYHKILINTNRKRTWSHDNPYIILYYVYGNAPRFGELKTR